MSRYYGINEYDCPADYYEAGNLGSRSPASIRRERENRARQSREEQERVNRKTWGMGVNE